MCRGWPRKWSSPNFLIDAIIRGRRELAGRRINAAVLIAILYSPSAPAALGLGRRSQGCTIMGPGCRGTLWQVDNVHGLDARGLDWICGVGSALQVQLGQDRMQRGDKEMAKLAQPCLGAPDGPRRSGSVAGPSVRGAFFRLVPFEMAREPARVWSSLACGSKRQLVASLKLKPTFLKLFKLPNQEVSGETEPKRGFRLAFLPLATSFPAVLYKLLLLSERFIPVVSGGREFLWFPALPWLPVTAGRGPWRLCPRSGGAPAFFVGGSNPLITRVISLPCFGARGLLRLQFQPPFASVSKVHRIKGGLETRQGHF